MILRSLPRREWGLVKREWPSAIQLTLRFTRAARFGRITRVSPSEVSRFHVGPMLAKKHTGRYTDFEIKAEIYCCTRQLPVVDAVLEKRQGIGDNTGAFV